MKQISLTIVIVLASISFASAQKYAYIDSEYILSKIPAYENAKTKLDVSSKEWQKDIEVKYAEVEKKYKEYQAEAPLLSSEMKNKREDEIIKLEKEANELKSKYFGEEGELYKKRQELVKPIQDEVFNAIKEIATEGSYGIIFDKSSGAIMIYTDAKYDVSDDVLKKLGY